MDTMEGAVGGLLNPGAGDVRSKVNPTTTLPTGCQTCAFDPLRDVKIIKDNSLPNGKIKLKLDENGLIPHVIEGKLLTKNETDNTDIIEGKCEEAHHVLSKNSDSSELLPNQDADQQELPDNSKPGDDTVGVSEMLDKLERLTASGFDNSSDIRDGIQYAVYESETQMPDIMRLITKDLSEPYSIYTYRYFIHNWPKLCFLAMAGNQCVGAIVCKLDLHKKMTRRGYIAMLAIDADNRRKRIGSNLVLKAIKAMIADECDEVVLETEITNKPALRLYENLGFVRDKRLFRYYLNGVDALRLKLWLS